MKYIGLALKTEQNADAIKLIAGLQKVLKTEYEVTAFADKLEDAVEDAVENAEIPIMVIDANEDYVDVASAVIRMFDLVNDPIFLIVNYEGLETEDLVYAHNIVGNVLLDWGIVNNVNDVNFEVMFFSPKGSGQAFSEVVESDATNADALVKLLDFYGEED